MFDDNEATTPTTLLGADQLPLEEQMVNADEALAEAIEETVEYEEDHGPLTGSIIRKIQERYEEADRQRQGDETRWLDAYRNYRGYYAKNERFTEHEKSRVFVKVTKTKVLAAYGQLVDVLFGTDKFPISISPTPVPEGAQEFVHINDQTTPQPGVETGMMPGGAVAPPPPTPRNPFDVGFEGDGYTLPPGAMFEDVAKGLDKRLQEGTDKLAPGISLTGSPQFKPASEAAKRMEKLIHDQIEESDGSTELRSALFEACLLGTGIIKGPFSYDKTVHKWEVDPESGTRVYKPQTVRVPKIEYCSVFDAFPDPNARYMNECEWFIQRHKLSKSQLRALRNRPFFKKDVITQVLNLPPNYVNKDYENELMAENAQIYPHTDRYEVLEYWGIMDKEDLIKAGVQGLENTTMMEEVQINAWVCHGKLLRLVLNPFTPKRIPYLAFDYERNPYSFFGVGVAENMSDSQKIMNGHARMAIDNLALAGNMVLDVDESALVPGQSMELFPGKMFKRATGMPGQAVYGIKFPNTAPENMQMFDKFRQIADEATGIPSYAHGQTGVMSTTRTAAGMSMLMGAASLNVKTVVKNIDDFLLRPLGEALFQWNMAFYEGELEIEGDLEVNAGGAASLMRNEIRSQRLTAFGQLLANPAIAPFVRIPAYIRAFVESLELDPDELVNDQDMATLYAQIIGMAGGVPQQQGMPAQMGQAGAVPPPAMPGEEAFSGNEPLSLPPEGME